MSIRINPGILKIKNDSGEYEQVNNLLTEGSVQEQLAAIAAKGAETLESIPDSYTELNNQVTNLKADLDDLDESVESMAPPYSSTSTYYVGALVSHDNVVHRCKIPVTSPEAWDSSKWEATTLGFEINDLVVGDTSDVIRSWLDVHPEATTTVQDGSLAEVKFTNDLKLKTIKDYVTPQMFGAIGDGENDDTQAIQQALDTRRPVYLPKGTYRVSSTINFYSSSYITGQGLQSVIKPLISFPSKNAILFCDSEISHFCLSDFAINLNNVDCRGIKISNPYNECIIKNVVIDNAINAGLYIGGSSLSQSLVVDNVMVLGSASLVPNESLGVFEYVYEMNLEDSKFMYRASKMGIHPCITLTKCWDLYARGNSFAFSSCEGVRLIGKTRYFRLAYNTYENVGHTDATDNEGNAVNASGILISALSTDNTEVEFIHGFIFETQYYNCADVINLQNSVGTLIVGPLSMVCDNKSYRNTCINTLSGTSTTYNANIGLGSLISVSDSLRINGKKNDYVLLANENNTTSYGLEVKKGSTILARFLNNNIINYANNGAIGLKDTNGKIWYLRVNTAGELIVSDS